MEIRPTKRTCIDSTTRWGDKLPFRIPTRTEQEFGELCTAAVLAGQTKVPTGPLRGPIKALGRALSPDLANKSWLTRSFGGLAVMSAGAIHRLFSCSTYAI